MIETTIKMTVQPKARICPDLKKDLSAWRLFSVNNV